MLHARVFSQQTTAECCYNIGVTFMSHQQFPIAQQSLKQYSKRRLVFTCAAFKVSSTRCFTLKDADEGILQETQEQRQQYWYHMICTLQCAHGVRSRAADGSAAQPQLY
jgi:hypothetical protein